MTLTEMNNKLHLAELKEGLKSARKLVKDATKQEKKSLKELIAWHIKAIAEIKIA